MKPPYDITPQILKLTAGISEKLGEVNARFLEKPSPVLRKRNKIKTIHSSLQIEGNSLTEEQITALLENKRVMGPEKDIREVLNALDVYDKIGTFSPFSVSSFRKAHKILMKGLDEDAGRFRTKSVGIVQGREVAHIGPPAENIPHLVKDLFHYLKKDEDPILIKSCVFHYEIEFIHPFADGNGRIGRLWQTVILMNKYPVFEYLPVESLISKTQEDYYHALVQSDRTASSTPFIEYLLHVVDLALQDLLRYRGKKLTTKERLEYLSGLHIKDFSRKDYLNIFKNISTSTASRDLKKGVEMGLLRVSGSKNKTKYSIIKK